MNQVKSVPVTLMIFLAMSFLFTAHSIEVKVIRSPMDIQCQNPRPNAPPQSIACVLANHCATCHSDFSPRFGALDLSRWISLSDSDSALTFPHRNSQGIQRSRYQTFEILLDRIVTDDRDAHMPLGYDLKPAEKQFLLEWIQANLKEE